MTDEQEEEFRKIIQDALAKACAIDCPREDFQVALFDLINEIRMVMN